MKQRLPNYGPPTPPVTQQDSERQAISWHAGLCYLCWYPGIKKVNGQLYCSKHAAKVGQQR